MQRILVVSAPSGAGKTTICNYIVSTWKDFELSVSHTTRKPRGNEVNGREYYFVSDEEFKRMIKEGAFVEYALVYGKYYYGTSWMAINRILEKGKNVVLDIDVQGAEQIKKRFNYAELIFILPPSYEELARRLYERKTDDPEEIKRRLKRAHEEIKLYKRFDYVVINDVLDETKKAIKAIIERSKEAEQFKPEHMSNKIAHLLSDKVVGNDFGVKTGWKEGT